MIVVSPHLDDAVLSCGQAIAAVPGSVIVTVFAGVPDSDLPVTDFDVRSGFTSANGAVEGRRAEDRRACAVLAADPVHLDFYDRQYGRANDNEQIVDALAGVLAEFTDETVLVPLGLVHPDHELIAIAARAAARRASVQVFAYEELPARVLWPERVPAAKAPIDLAQGPIELKEAAIACYRSQHWALDRHACLVPERFRCA